MQSPQPQAPTAAAFTTEANHFLADLAREHQAHLQSGDDNAVLIASRAAAAIRRAAIVYVAANEILPAVSLRQSARLAREANYLRGLVHRLWQALVSRDVSALAMLSDAAQTVLDGFQVGDRGLFADVNVVPFSLVPAELATDDQHTTGAPTVVSSRAAGLNAAPHALQGEYEANLEIEADEIPAPSRKKTFGRTPQKTSSKLQGASAAEAHKRWRHCCGLSFADLSSRDKLVLWLYLVMVILALGAITAVTVDFVRQEIDPGSFIRSSVSDSLPAPVVTVCLSQRGVPFSRLQFFNFTDAEGRDFVGADPRGPQKERQSEEFEAAVGRFWDNPGNEDCNSVVGDFFPFPLNSLNDLTAGRKSTQCRPCYRVGRKQLAIARSTDFQNSSVLSLYTDNYFLQCLKRAGGLSPDALEFLKGQLLQNKTELFSFNTLSYPGGSVDGITEESFSEIDSKQACNIFYFSFFPKALQREDTSVDIRYEFDGNKTWTPVGDGPYFNLKESQDFLPEESLQMYVSTNASTKDGAIGSNRDVILIGPNTQTFATFRSVVVYEVDRYDISSSTSNLLQSSITPIFGYWLVYRIFYNYNRFVTDEWYQESTYPASQWFVDLTGYASLFTGASLFSLLLLPLLRAMRKREKQRLIKQQPEVYLWSQHKQRFQESVRSTAPANPEMSEGGNLMRGSSVMLPGYNV